MAADRGALNRLRWMIAGTVLAGGTASAAYLNHQGPAGGPVPDVRPLQALAQRIQQMPEPQSRLIAVPALASGTSTSRSTPRHTASQPASAHNSGSADAANGAEQPQTAPVLSPIKTLALIGVTMVGDKEAAWLVDLESHDRFTANEGDDVEGLHVRDIQPDHVILTQNGTDYELRLGEKSAELAAAEPVEVASTTTTDQQNQNGRGWGGRGRWGGRNGGGRGNSGGYSGGNRYAGNTSGFRPPTFGGFRGGGGFNGGSNSNNTNYQRRLTKPTSNPQEARRKGVRLVGNVSSSLPQPPAFFNPQTVRRVGSATGHAFGADNSNNRRAINSTDPSRSTSAIR